MQTILVPVDFSAASDNAGEYAAQLAKTFNARLILFHAYMLPTPVSEVPYVLITADEMEQENQKLMKGATEALASKYDIPITSMVRIGIASDEVKSLCKEEPVDLIVMGMKGAGGFEKIVGSTTTNVLHKVKTPVLIIPHDAKYKTIGSVAYASDFSDASKPDLFHPLMVFLQKYNPAITILHVHTAHSGENPDSVTVRKGLGNIFQDQLYSFVTVENSSVIQGIHQFLGENSTDLLVMIAHKHGFFERLFSRNHTDAMAYETHTPMLVLQDKD